MAPGGLPLMAPSAAPTGDAGPRGAAGGRAAGGHRGLHGYAGEKRQRQRREPKQSFGSFLRSPFGGGGNRREGERERKLSRSLKRPSAIPSFHQRAWQKLALGVIAKNRFGIHLIFDSRQQLCLSPNCIWAPGSLCPKVGGQLGATEGPGTPSYPVPSSGSCQGGTGPKTVLRAGQTPQAPIALVPACPRASLLPQGTARHGSQAAAFKLILI